MFGNSMSARRLSRLRKNAVLATLALCCSLGGAAIAIAGYPENPVRLIVPFAPGGAVDGVARLTAEGVSKELGQQIVVENRPGAGGVIGIGAVAHAKPDGYTMLMGNIALTSAPALYNNLPFDPIKDFSGVVIIGRSPYVLVVSPNFPAHSVKELIALAKASPGKYNFASAGTGSAIHLAGELFKSTAKINSVHIPFNGAGPAGMALLGGQVQIMFGSLMEMMPMIQSGKVHALAVTSSQRTDFAPNLPTVEESGLPGYEVMGWYGLFVPAHTPADVVAKIHDSAIKALQSPAMKKQLQT